MIDTSVYTGVPIYNYGVNNITLIYFGYIMKRWHHCKYSTNTLSLDFSSIAIG